MSYQTIAIIVPVFNEATHIRERLPYFQRLNTISELIFVDGGSIDGSAEQLRLHGHTVLDCTQVRNRGAQLARGIRHTNKSVICMHHCDTILPTEALTHISDGLDSHVWGRFDITIDNSHWPFRIIETLINWRSCLSAIATGDQCIFARRDYLLPILAELDQHPLMEDIYLSRQLRKHSRPACLSMRVTTSARYWQKHGICKSIVTMWWLRLQYFCGRSAYHLYLKYYR